MRVLKNIIATLLLVFTLGCSAKVPLSVDKAKRTIEKNYNQIKAISDFHDLAMPTTIFDTVKTVVPSYFRSGDIKSPNFLSRLDTAFYKFVAPTLKDGTDVQKVYREVIEVVKPVYIDTTYVDSLSTVRIYGYEDSLRFDVKIKEREIDVPITYESEIIDTDVRWYEDRFVKIALILVIGGAITVVILSVIKKEPN